jgi:DNA-binding response OmpR family regulator
MKTIVIVDDDSANMGLLQLLLEMEGHKALACRTIEEAKTAAEPDTNAFVVDCRLAKGVSGINLLEDIRAGETAVPPPTTVIMVSGDARLQEKSLEAGADAFLLKPYSPNELTKTLNALLAKKEQSGQTKP